MKVRRWGIIGIIVGVLIFGSTGASAKQVRQEAYTPTASLGKFVAEDEIGEVYSEVTVNLKADTVYVDGEKTDLQEVLGVSEAKEEKLFNASPAKVIEYVENNTVCEAEKISSNKIVITNNFQTHRLIATVDEIEETYGAVDVVKGITAYFLKYESEEATKEAYDKLVEDYGEDKIFYDEVFSIDEVLCESDTVNSADETESTVEQSPCAVDEPEMQQASTPVYTSEGYVDTAKTLGLDSINEQINNSKYSENKVTVAVLDTGLTYTTNPSCEIGRKLRDKRKDEWMYAFDGTGNAGDVCGHGTMVSSVIAYNTPDNVQYCMFKIVDSAGYASDAFIYSAFEQAYMLDIDIVNYSFGAALPIGSEGVRLFDAILKKLYEKGTIVCCSAGNDNNHYIKTNEYGIIVKEYDTSADCYVPANSDYVLCVSALKMTSGGLFAKADRSNTGNTVDYSAIGENVYVYTKTSKENGIDGTSFSTPQVAAQFAILKTCSDSYKSVSEMQTFYNLYLDPDSKTADSTIYGAGYFDLSNCFLCTVTHSRCCGLWHYNGTPFDYGKFHTLTIDLNGGTGYGYTSDTTTGWASKFTRIFMCGTEVHFASAYSYQAENSFGWIQFGETAKSGSGEVTNPYTPYREGYLFAGWKCSGYGSVHKRLACLGGKYTEVWYYNGEDNENITLTAQWVPKNLYNTLIVDPNGGTMYNGKSKTSEPFTINYKINAYRVLCDSSSPGYFTNKAVGEPRRTGYTFVGWSVTSDEGFVGKIINQAAYFTDEFYGFYESMYAHAYYSDDYNETSATVQAVWVPNIYKVNLKVSSTFTIASGSVTYGKGYGRLLNCVPTKSGYVFNGWYTEQNGGRRITSATEVTIAEDHDLYAHWVPNTYKVNLKLDNTEIYASGEVTYNKVYGPLLCCTPTKEGYTFDGWYTELSGGDKIVPTNKVTIAGNHNLYAHWIAIKEE